jgi:Xaa-Pro aminopeptidase
VWEVVKGARDAAIAFVQQRVAARQQLHGYEVDDVARAVVEQHGYGDFFLHRTGHSIGDLVHGNGVNIDNLETRDQRKIIPGVCFSIEPGVYLKDFGVRSEVDMFVGDGQAEVTGEIQRELLLLA